jgi:hypothetical protein
VGLFEELDLVKPLERCCGQIEKDKPQQSSLSVSRLIMVNKSLTTKGLALFLTAFMFGACFEEDMNISLEDQLPPTFKLSGSGNLAFFGVWEVSTENLKRVPSERDGDKDSLLWQIWPNGLSSDAKVLRRLPPITYGSLPPGFIQKVPETGAPPALVEGKIYEAGGPASNGRGGFIWFKIENGKLLKVVAPGGN